MHGDHREHHERRDVGDPRQTRSRRDPLLRCGAGDASASGVPRDQDRSGLRQARIAGAVRATRRRGHRRPEAPGPAAPHRARGARPDVLQARPDPLDAAGPAPAGVHRRARHVAGQRAAAVRSGGRVRDGGGARRSVGGRVRDRGATAARRRHDRAGPPGVPGDGAEGRHQDPATRRSRVDRTGSRAARGVRGEGREAPELEARDRHGGRLPAPVGLAPTRARLPAGSIEHAAARGGARVLPAGSRSRTCTTTCPRHGCS